MVVNSLCIFSVPTMEGFVLSQRGNFKNHGLRNYVVNDSDLFADLLFEAEMVILPGQPNHKSTDVLI